VVEANAKEVDAVVNEDGGGGGGEVDAVVNGGGGEVVLTEGAAVVNAAVTEDVDVEGVAVGSDDAVVIDAVDCVVFGTDRGSATESKGGRPLRSIDACGRSENVPSRVSSGAF